MSVEYYPDPPAYDHYPEPPPRDHYPDPPVDDHVPEYSCVNDDWLNGKWLKNYRPAPYKPPKPARPFLLIPQTCIDTNCHDVFPDVEAPQLAVIRGGKSGPLAPKQKRRDAAALVVDCAGALEHALALFDREADEESLIEIDPQLRRVVRASNHLTRKASRARHRMQVQGTLF